MARNTDFYRSTRTDHTTVEKLHQAGQRALDKRRRIRMAERLGLRSVQELRDLEDHFSRLRERRARAKDT